MLVSAKSADLVCIEQVGGSVGMPGWVWCEMRDRCEQQQAEIERLTRELDEAREAALFLRENAEDVAAGRCYGLSQAWPWL